MASSASSSQSNTRALPLWCIISGATALRLTTQPSGARLPLSTAMPPVLLYGSDTGRMTSVSLISQPAIFSPTVLPVQVGRPVSTRPSFESSCMTAYTPPASFNCSMKWSPAGAKWQRFGVFAEISFAELKSSSMPHSCAIAGGAACCSCCSRAPYRRSGRSGTPFAS